jgi:hypothetical protein
LLRIGDESFVDPENCAGLPKYKLDAHHEWRIYTALRPNCRQNQFIDPIYTAGVSAVFLDRAVLLRRSN